jgi:DNA-directed RNA polymerase sigma subunit (sigma70/sigma32)
MTRSPTLLKMGPQEAVIREMENDQLWESIEAMPDRERRVLVRRYGLVDREPANLAELAAELGISRDRVRRLQRNAERQLRKRSTPWPGKFKITRFSDFVSVFPDKENAPSQVSVS